jgi:hypothetical protein
MFKLPDYEIIAWILCNKFGKKLEKEVLSSIDKMPYESMEYQGVLAIHWEFNTWDETVNHVRRMKGFIDNPNLVFLRANNRNDENASVVYKDERPVKKAIQTDRTGKK